MVEGDDEVAIKSPSFSPSLRPRLGLLAGGCRKTSRPIFEFSVFREHAVPALDWQGCMQVREAATSAEGPRYRIA